MSNEKKPHSEENSCTPVTKSHQQEVLDSLKHLRLFGMTLLQLMAVIGLLGLALTAFLYYWL